MPSGETITAEPMPTWLLSLPSKNGPRPGTSACGLRTRALLAVTLTTDGAARLAASARLPDAPAG